VKYEGKAVKDPKCSECRAVKATEADPRELPLDYGVCLCTDCAIEALREVYEKAEDEMRSAKEELERLGAEP